VKFLRAPVVVDGGQVTIHASIGVVIVDASGPSGDELLHMADVAMYNSKSHGKGLLTVWSNNLADTPSPNKVAASDIESAINNDELFLEYQPVFDLTTNAMVGFEALIRWRHPDLGVLAPEQFLGLAEDLGLGARLGEWVIDHAIADIDRIDPPAWISINVDARHLIQRDIAGYLARQLEQHDCPATRVIVELTENQFLSGTPAAIQRLEEIRDLGVRIAIDDFGAGYSSVAYLEALPFDVVKIDRGLISGSITARMAELLAWVNQLSVMVDAMIILEGIETPPQLDVARRAGLRYGQGYLLARPGALLPREAVDGPARLPSPNAVS
jgi:EAL domain-containing protein (putative c-di-GMP-specific phosphodiesterase class I)